MIVLPSEPQVVIDGTPGGYLLDPESATGKTYLYRVLNALSGADRSIVAYTWADYQAGLDLMVRFQENPPRLVMLDMYDLYCADEKIHRALLSVIRSAVILVDLKHGFRFPLSFGLASIGLYEDHIEVICDTALESSP